MQLPDGLTRYTGTTPIGVRDAAGNTFHAFQGPNDSGMCVMVPADGSAPRRVGPILTKSGRPGLLCNPFEGLWLIGNKESGERGLPPLYPIAEFVPCRMDSAPGGGGPVAAEDAAPIAAFGAEAWPNYGAPYADESLIRDGRWYVRANKIVGLLVQIARAVAQLQRLARARGELR